MLGIMADFQPNSTGISYTTTNATDPTKEDSGGDDGLDPMQYLVYVTESHIEPMIFLFGIVTNVLTFMVIRKMRISKIIRTLLLTLTVTDFLTSLLGFINIMLEIVIFKGDMPYGMWLMGVVEIFTTYKLFLMFLGMSSALVILIAVVRCYSMLNPFEWQSKITNRRIVKIIVAIILVTIVLFIPLSLYIMWKACFAYEQNPDDIESIPGDPTVCLAFYNIFPDAWKVRYYFFVIALLLGPGTVLSNLVCFILLKRAINQSAKAITEMQGSNSSEVYITEQQNHRNARINKMFLWVLLFNSICITPSIVQVICLQIDPQKYLFDKSNLFVAIMDIVAEVFLGALPCYNFWTYLIVNRDFRRRFCYMFCCRKNSKENMSRSRTPERNLRPEHIHIGDPQGNQV